jgi:MinD-like ATPase involved in chromosome partitioning or flagellar assembly
VTRTPTLHLDEARNKLLSSLREKWDVLKLERALVIEDAFGRFSLGCWGSRDSESSLRSILDGIGPYGASLFWAPNRDEYDPLELDRSWDDATSIDGEDGEGIPEVRRIVRHRMLPAWQQCRKEPMWPLDSHKQCPIVSFYSFKGGMGRTTALAAFAVNRALRSERVVAVDLDLDAPGLGSVLPVATPAPPYGVVDYLLEAPIIGHRPDDLLEYCSIVDLGKASTSGSIRMFTAGRMDTHYLGKIARLDFEQPDDETARHPLDEFLLQIREQFEPDWLLLDSRTGFSETAGVLLSGLAHLHVLVGVESTQSWEGLTYAIRKLGAERLVRGYQQGEVLLVHGLVPDLKKDALSDLTQRFLERSKDVFQSEYYAADDENPDDNIWYLGDAVGNSSPHWPWPLSYSSSLAQSVALEDLIETLESNRSGYLQFCETLVARAKPGAKA